MSPPDVTAEATPSTDVPRSVVAVQTLPAQATSSALGEPPAEAALAGAEAAGALVAGAGADAEVDSLFDELEPQATRAKAADRVMTAVRAARLLMARDTTGL
jgi:hypothetical protein